MVSTRKEDDQLEPFPVLSPVTEEQSIGFNTDTIQQDRPRTSTTTTPSSPSSPIKKRAGSIRRSLINSSPPLGVWQAIGQDTAKIPTFPEIRDGSFSSDGWTHEGQLERRNHNPHDIHKRRLSMSRSPRTSMANDVEGESPGRTPESHSVPSQDTGTQVLETPRPQSAPQGKSEKMPEPKYTAVSLLQPEVSHPTRSSPGPDETGTYPNGYRFPKKHNWKQSFAIFGKAFWKFFTTPAGFLITVYGLNVVAWGAMIFFLLIPGATPAMCKSYPDCENKTYSARQIWIENTSQILNALFCVTAFGLLPWRARDFYFMIRKQLLKDHDAHRRLAGYYSGWYRLPGSDSLPEDLAPPPAPVKPGKKKGEDIEKANSVYTKEELEQLLVNPSIPLPLHKMAPAPLTGIRAPPTGFNKLAWMIWMYIWNTLFQVCLCVVMWHFTKYNRPSWATALFIVLGCGTGIVAGIITFKEGKKVKEIEGVPVKEYDVEESAEDYRERIAKREKKMEKQRKLDREEISELGSEKLDK